MKTNFTVKKGFHPIYACVYLTFMGIKASCMQYVLQGRICSLQGWEHPYMLSLPPRSALELVIIRADRYFQSYALLGLFPGAYISNAFAPCYTIFPSMLGSSRAHGDGGE